MNAIGFQEHELATHRVKVANEWQTKTFPVVGGRLRIPHEKNDNISIQTDIMLLVLWTANEVLCFQRWKKA